MSLSDWLNRLETLHPVTIDLGLTRVQRVAELMGLLQLDCPVITVGGTNGKGSTIAFLESIYRHAGYRVGTYTSPHLLRYNERIRIVGVDCTDEAIIQAFEQIEIARGDISLTYFEYGTLAALYLLKQAQLDLILLEVGLGGRLDAVNIINPDIAIITSIDLDHTDWLGNTREAIGFEKAGIFRANVPAICGDFNTPETIFDHAAKLGAPLYCQGKNFTFHQGSDSWSWESQSFRGEGLPLPFLAIQNASTALMAVTCLQSQLPVNIQSIKDGIAEARVLGRFQCIQAQPEVILDVAHNPAAANLLARRLQSQPISGKTYAVFSALQDKDSAGIVAHFKEIVAGWYVAPLDTPRGATLQQLNDALEHDVPRLVRGILEAPYISPQASILAAYRQAILQCSPNDRIIVFGSFFTVAAVLNLAGQHETSRR